MAVPMWLLLGLHTGQTLQYAAVLLRLVGLAALAQGGELLFKLRQLSHALIHMGNVLVKHLVDTTAAVLRPVGQR